MLSLFSQFLNFIHCTLQLRISVFVVSIFLWRFSVCAFISTTLILLTFSLHSLDIFLIAFFKIVVLKAHKMPS